MDDHDDESASTLRRDVDGPAAWGRRRWLRAAVFGGLAGASLGVPGVAEAARFSTVVIDPGHGGSDNGAKWGGVAEKHLTLDLAKRLGAILSKKGVRPVLTRTSDQFVSLDARAAKANRYSSAVFVSVHFNAHLNRSIRGIETFYMSSRGKTLATLVQRRLMSRVRSVNRGIKQVSGFAVLRKTKCPAILVECGFLSNSWERQRCAASWYRQIVAQLIAEGILQYR